MNRMIFKCPQMEIIKKKEKKTNKNNKNVGKGKYTALFKYFLSPLPKICLHKNEEIEAVH